MRVAWLLLLVSAVGSVQAETASVGETVYKQWCAGCHDPEIAMNSGTRRLAIRSGEERAVLLERDDLPESFIKTVVRNGVMMMPPFRQSEISDAELDALAAFLAGGDSEGSDE